MTSFFHEVQEQKKLISDDRSQNIVYLEVEGGQYCHGSGIKDPSELLEMFYIF